MASDRLGLQRLRLELLELLRLVGLAVVPLDHLAHPVLSFLELVGHLCSGGLNALNFALSTSLCCGYSLIVVYIRGSRIGARLY